MGIRLIRHEAGPGCGSHSKAAKMIRDGVQASIAPNATASRVVIDFSMPATEG